jgi:hypothetical protein
VFVLSIQRLLRQTALGPNEIGLLEAVYEDALRTLRLPDRANPITQIVAKRIIEVAQTGENDPKRTKDLALADLGYQSKN